MDSTTATIRPIPLHSTPDQNQYNLSLPSSPRSSALPSPPDSPSSVSSFPSVSSSFFFSSAAASPPHPHNHHNHHHIRDDICATQLIIPSLTLPTALRRPTPYGQTLGDLKLLVLGTKSAGKHFLEGLLLEDNEDVVEVGAWDDFWQQDDVDAAENGLLPRGGGVKVLRASTDWVEHRDAHGLEKFEPTKNVEVVKILGYDPAASSDHVRAGC